MSQEQDVTKTVVRIFGSEYTLISQSDSSYMTKIAQFVHQHMTNISEANPRLDTHRLSVLASVHIADELFRYQESKTGTYPQALGKPDIQSAYDQLLLDYEALQEQLNAITEYQADDEIVSDMQMKLEDFVDLSQASPDGVRSEQNEELAKLKQAHEQLLSEYEKLKTEFNEWTQIIYTGNGDHT